MCAPSTVNKGIDDFNEQKGVEHSRNIGIISNRDKSCPLLDRQFTYTQKRPSTQWMKWGRKLP